MKKKFLLICLLLFLFTVLGAQVRVLYKCLETNDTTSQIRFNISIRNDNSSQVNLNDLAVRYYYTETTEVQNLLHLDYSPIGEDAMELSQTASYFEIRFISDSMLGAFSTLGEFQLRLSKSNWSVYNQTDDYSYLPEMTTLGENHKIALFQGQELLWGNPPVDYENFFYINLIGADDEEVYVSTWGSENSTTRLPAQFPKPVDFTAVLSQIDIPQGQLGGKFLWTIDGMYSYGSYSSENRWIYPHCYSRGEEINVEYKDYDEIIEMPTLPPLPTNTPPAPFIFTGRVLDGSTGQLMTAPGFQIRGISAKDLSESFLIEEAEFNYMRSFYLVYDHYVEISAPGYHTVKRSIHSSRSPVEFVLYPEDLSTPLPESNWIFDNPYSTPTPLPENPGTWYLSRVDIPPEMDYYNDGTVKAHIKVPFFPAAARALDWGEPQISGNQIVINAQLIQWDGPAPFWNYNLEHTYDLGQLDMSMDYEIQLQMWDQPIWTYSLSVSDIEIHEVPVAESDDYYDPHFKTRWFWSRGNYMELSALLYDNSTLICSVESWGEPRLEGSTITVEPVISQAEDLNRIYVEVHSVSTYYDLKNIPAGDYTFQVVMNNKVFLSEALSLPAEMPPHATAPPDLNYSKLSDVPIVEILSVPEKVEYPQSRFEIEIVNYGVAGEIVLADYLSDYPVSYSQESYTIARGEKLGIEASIDWDQLLFTESRISYNGFAVKSDSGIMEIQNWRVELVNNQSDLLSISGKTQLDLAEGVPIIHLSGDVERTTQPDINGNYIFHGLQPGGDYSISVEYIPNRPVIEILSPKEGITIEKTLKVEAKVSTTACSILYYPETIEILNLSENLSDQNFEIDDYSDCCLTITECYVSLDSLKIAQSLNPGMCHKEYLFYLDMSSYNQNYYDLTVSFTDELGRITEKSVQIFNRLDPPPTPTADCCFSSSFFEPRVIYGPREYDFTIDFSIIPESYRVAAYEMVFAYDPDFLSLNIQEGSDGIDVGEDGFLTEFTDVDGLITITGMDANGTGPSREAQKFLKFYFTTLEKEGVTKVEIIASTLFQAEAFKLHPFEGALANIYIGLKAEETCPYEPGDVDGNGSVNIIDALLIAQYYVGIPGVTIAECAADVDNLCQELTCIRNINIVDALLVAQYYVGLIKEF